MCRGSEVYDVVAEEEKVWLERGLRSGRGGSRKSESELHSKGLTTVLRSLDLILYRQEETPSKAGFLWRFYSKCEKSIYTYCSYGSGFVLIFAEEKMELMSHSS